MSELSLHSSEPDPGRKKKAGAGRVKRQKVSKACVFCQRSHMSCDDERPCQRCIKRNISHLCRDKEPAASESSGDSRKKAKHSGDIEAAGTSTAALEPDAGPIGISALTSSTVSDRAAHSRASALSVSTEPAVLPAIAPAHPSIMSQGTMATPAAVPLHTDRAASLPGIDMAHTYIGKPDSSARNPNLPPAASVLSGNSPLGQIGLSQNASRPHADGARAGGEAGGPARAPKNAGFDSNSFLFFGNDVASNEFSALNEFLESLQRGVRGADRLGPEARLSNPPSGSPSAPPSIPNAGSPPVESFHQGLQPPIGSIQPPLPPPPPQQQQQQQQASPVASSNGGSIQPGGGMPGADTGIGTGSHDQQPRVAHHQTRTHCLPTITQLMTNNAGEGVTQTERFLLTAADPNDGTSEDKLRQIINAKYEAGFLKPYNYVNSYTRMQRFMETNISRPNIIRILEVLNTFRPTFRTIAQSLTDIDLLLVEEGFERLLLDYDNVFNSFGVPACLWRRTGEIYKANREFADLVGVPLSYFHEGKVCIYELMTESSTVNYWEKYGEIAFDATQKAVLTSCILQTAASVRTMVHSNAEKGLGDSRAMSSSSIALKIGGLADQPSPSQPGRPVRCCFSFTLRRDKYKIPLAIAGNFMPIQAQGQSLA